jgi:peptidyl-prolyl cis-trans isomerase C
MALGQEGDISGLVPSDFGYHIIQYFRDGAGPVPFEMMKDDIISTQGGNEKAAAYTDFISGLKENAEVKTYVNRI